MKKLLYKKIQFSQNLLAPVPNGLLPLIPSEPEKYNSFYEKAHSGRNVPSPPFITPPHIPIKTKIDTIAFAVQ